MLHKCLRTLRKSLIKAGITYEIIAVINDANNYKYVFPFKYKVIKNPSNLGYAKAANLGANNSIGKYLLFSNPDIIVSVNCIKALLYQLKTNNNIALVSPKILNKNQTLQYSILPPYNLWHIFIEQTYLYRLLPRIFTHSYSDTKLYESPKLVKSVSGVFFLIRKTTWQKINGFNEKYFLYFEDFDLCKRLISTNCHILYYSVVSVIHYLHQSSNGEIVAEYFIASAVEYLKQQHGKLYVVICLLFMKFGASARYYYWRLRYALSPEKNYNYKKGIFYGNMIKNINSYFSQRFWR